VRSLSGGALRRRWQAVFGRPPPEHLTADLLRRMIANRVQEEAFGTLDRATLKLLDGLARRDGSRTAACLDLLRVLGRTAGFARLTFDRLFVPNRSFTRNYLAVGTAKKRKMPQERRGHQNRDWRNALCAAGP
jgi:hypothetical protein